VFLLVQTFYFEQKKVEQEKEARKGGQEKVSGTIYYANMEFGTVTKDNAEL